MKRALLLLLPACSLYFGNGGGPDASPGSGGGGGGATLTKTRAIAGEHQVAGIDSDGAGGLWIAYRDPTGGYYSIADVWVTHLDESLAKVSEWYFHDEYTVISGLAFTGDRVWINYNENSGNNHLRVLDAATGTTLGTVATENGIVDLTYSGGQIVMSNLWNQMIGIDPVTGGEQWRTSTNVFEASTQRGIAYDNGQFWLASAFTAELYLVDQDGTLVETATLAIDDPTEPHEGQQLAWDGSELIFAVDNQIMWLD
jgi:hypothetical protein